jgi:hypothetical protein
MDPSPARPDTRVFRIRDGILVETLASQRASLRRATLSQSANAVLERCEPLCPLFDQGEPEVHPHVLLLYPFFPCRAIVAYLFPDDTTENRPDLDVAQLTYRVRVIDIEERIKEAVEEITEEDEIFAATRRLHPSRGPGLLHLRATRRVFSRIRLALMSQRRTASRILDRFHSGIEEQRFRAMGRTEEEIARIRAYYENRIEWITYYAKRVDRYL